MSQSAFAEAFGITRTAVGAYEEGRAEPKLDVVVRIANLLGVSLDDLLCRDIQGSGVGAAQKAVNQGVPLVKADEVSAFVAAVADGAAYSSRQYIQLPGVAEDMIAIELGRSILIADALRGGNFLGVDNGYHHLLLRRSGIALATGRVGDADAVRCYRIHYIIKCYDADDHTALILEDIAARLSRMEERMG